MPVFAAKAAPRRPYSRSHRFPLSPPENAFQRVQRRASGRSERDPAAPLFGKLRRESCFEAGRWSPGQLVRLPRPLATVWRASRLYILPLWIFALGRGMPAQVRSGLRRSLRHGDLVDAGGLPAAAVGTRPPILAPVDQTNPSRPSERILDGADSDAPHIFDAQRAARRSV